MIQLRNATPEDLPLLLHWDNQPHVIDSDPDDDWNWEYELACNPPWREQLMATLDERPIGFVQIINPAQKESHYWGDIAEGTGPLTSGSAKRKTLVKVMALL